MARLLAVLVGCLAPLAACGTAAPPARPSPPLVSPATTPAPAGPGAASRPGAAAGPTPIATPSHQTRPAGRPAVITVVLDPGHNGANASHPEQINRQVPTGRGGTKPCNTTGTATAAGYSEAAFNWDVTLRVRDALTTRGVQVVLTRADNSGVGPCVHERAAIANRAGAVATVSIHADGATPSGRGFHVAYSDPPLNAGQGPPSAALAEMMAGALRASGFSAADYIGSAGLDARSDLAGLNHARVPAVLVECANMRNSQEAALMSTPAGRARYGVAITDGILAWLVSRGLIG